MRYQHFHIIIVFCILLPLPSSASECVILLHGILRTEKSMLSIQEAFEKSAYIVANINYPSRKKPIPELAKYAVEKGLQQCNAAGSQTVHFVTHSLGGILVRYYLTHNDIPNLGRVVMLAPPNHGSKIVDFLYQIPGIFSVFGPAASQLGTESNHIFSQLGPISYPVGIIAGTRSKYFPLALLVSDPSDGVVSVQSVQLEGMTDMFEVDAYHSWIIHNSTAIFQALVFIERGIFIH